MLVFVKTIVMEAVETEDNVAACFDDGFDLSRAPSEQKLVKKVANASSCLK